MSENTISQDELDSLLNSLPQEKTDSDKQLFYAQRLEADILMISIRGRVLGQNNSLTVIHQITDAIAGKDIKLILDLSNCSYLSSIVLGAMAGIAEKVIKNGKKLSAFGANDIITELLHLAMFTEFMELFDTLEEALLYEKK